MGDKLKGLLGQVLDNIPGIGGKRAYKRARKYIRDVHGSTPEELEAYKKAGDRSYNIKSTTGQLTNEVNDRTVDHQFKSNILGHPTSMPERYIYSNYLSDKGDTQYNQTIFGTKAGHTTSESGRKYRAVDKDNIAKMQYGRHILGFPVGFSGSVIKNPGIDPRIDQSYFRNQIDASGMAPIERMDLYGKNNGI